MNQWRWRWQKFLILAIATVLIIASGQRIAISQPEISTGNLPPSKVHPLPPFLARWQDPTSGDYFPQVDATPLGYLIWHQFPVKVYVQQPTVVDKSAASQRFQDWVKTVNMAIAEWSAYLPLQEVDTSETADITIWRSPPPREIKRNSDTGLYDIPRAITAETTYQFYLQQNPSRIAHKMKIDISPNYTGTSLLATIRHELGHALGIWGHSDQETDALYFSQVRDAPQISPRDLNTLKKIYQQPTKLGWKL